jgi:hypothetical protein
VRRPADRGSQESGKSEAVGTIRVYGLPMRSRPLAVPLIVAVLLAACGGDDAAAPAASTTPVSIGRDPVTTTTAAPTTVTETTTTTVPAPTTTTRVDASSTDRAAVTRQVIADYQRGQETFGALAFNPTVPDALAQIDSAALPGSEVHAASVEGLSSLIAEATSVAPIDAARSHSTSSVEVVTLDGDGPWNDAKIRVCDVTQAQEVKAGPSGEAIPIEGTARRFSTRRWYTLQLTDAGWKLRDFGVGESFLEVDACPPA